jgi:hypothetical protein
VPAHEVLAHEMLVHEVLVHEVLAPEVPAHEVPAHEVPAHEGFCEDLARQITAAYMFQLQLGFRRCRIWVSVVAGVS